MSKYRFSREMLGGYNLMESLFLNLGIKCVNNGLWPEAEEAFRKALELNPDYAQACSNLGFVLKQTHRPEEAEVYLRKAINLNPKLIASYNNLSLILMHTNRLEEAEAVLRKAIHLDANSPDLYNNLGSVLTDAGRPRQAEAAFQQAIKINPSFVYAHYNLGCLLKSAGHLDESETALRRALKLRPNYSSAQFALATLHLLRGQYEKGWELYNAHRMKKASGKATAIPRWQGEELTGKTILLFHEQGFGDTLQASRYIPQVSTLSQHTVVWIQEPLQQLMRSSFPDIDFYTGKDNPSEHFDYACPLPNLPMIFHMTEQNIPNDTPYLKVSEEIINAWRSRLQEKTGASSYKTGLVWAGNPNHHNDRNRSIAIAAFDSLLAMDKIAWISLQAGSETDNLPECASSLLDFSSDLVDFAQTAGLIENLDLVITVDSAVAHLAGALGKETWVLIPFEPDWRWQLKREDSPWYPSIRLFRQRKPGDWQYPLKKVKEALQQRRQ